ncbi:hypothetical protein 7F23_30 [uncultured Caudovirales phage]|uniref:HIRAN domain-containing protein n=1 Tax=uncultured Caudovirales phage TaxID=2100421 RepID=A0A2H4J549_9CAUD|nr:hypothetical protein 7F23_30 [uncultured Caudovirales phage]
MRRLAKQIARDEDIAAYGGYTNKEMLEGMDEISEFEDLEFGEYIYLEKDPNNEYDKNAIKVYLEYPEGKKHHIGHVPKKDNIKVAEVMDSNKINSFNARIVGGKIKEVEYDFEKDKDVVVIKELTIGVEITIYID